MKPQTSLLDRAEWRVFRLFLVDLEDGDLVRIGRQLAARHERESDFTRLFFSSLQAADLQAAHDTIRAEHRARAQDHRIFGRMAKKGDRQAFRKN